MAKQRHNYRKKLERLARNGLISTAPGLHNIVVQHDEWCALFRGQRCNCSPDIIVARLKFGPKELH